MKRRSSYTLGSDISFRVKRLDTGTSNRMLEKARARVLFTSVCFLFFFSLVILRMFEVSTYNRPVYLMSSSGAFSLDMKMKRADIVDRNGVIVATSLPVVNLYAQPRLLKDAGETVKALVSVFPEMKESELYAKLDPSKSFVYIKRNLTPNEQFEVNRLGIPALNFEQSEIRVYPQGSLFSHILGFVDVDNNGVSGLEFSFDTKLKESKEALRLSVDVGIQDIVREQVLEAMDVFKAKSATAVVMDVNNGEILSMVSLPDFDPNNHSSSPKENFFNQATLGVYEVGSVFKLFNTAMAIESRKVKLTDTFDATKPLVMARHKITDFSPKNRWLDVEEILVYSSNIGSARIALEVGGEKQKDFLGKIGFFNEVPLELPERGKPLVPSVWRDVNVATISYGYGLAVSPLHVISAMSAMVNGGRLFPATLLVREGGYSAYKQVISPKTSDTLRYLMRQVVMKGARLADTKGYYVGGKTGSAQIRINGKYVEGKLRTTFIGAFPIDNPRYGIIVSLNEPHRIEGTYGNTAGWNATPTAGKIIEKIAPLLDILPNPEYQQKITKPIIEANFVRE